LPFLLCINNSSVFSGLWGRVIACAVAEDTVADADIVIAEAPFCFEGFAFFGLEHFAGAVDPAGVDAKAVCGEHHIADDEASVLDVGEAIAV